MRLMTNNPSELNFDILFPSTTPPTTHPPPQKNAYTAGYGVTSFSCVPGWLGNKQTNKQTNKQAAHSTSFLKNKNKNCFYHYTGECIHADSKLRCLGFCHKELQRHHALNWNNKKDWVVLTGLCQMTPRPSKVLKDKYDVIVIFRLLDIALNTWTLNYVLFTACHKKRWRASKPSGGKVGGRKRAFSHQMYPKLDRQG